MKPNENQDKITMGQVKGVRSVDPTPHRPRSWRLRSPTFAQARPWAQESHIGLDQVIDNQILKGKRRRTRLTSPPL